MHMGNSVGINFILFCEQTDKLLNFTVFLRLSTEFGQIVQGLFALRVLFSHYIQQRYLKYSRKITVYLNYLTNLQSKEVSLYQYSFKHRKLCSDQNLQIQINLVALLFIIRAAMLEANLNAQNCNIDDDLQGLLSSKVKQLDLTQNKIKFLSSLQEAQSKKNQTKRSNKTLLATMWNQSKTLKNSSKRMKQASMKKSNQKRQECKKKEHIYLQDGKMFQMGVVKNGRMPVLTEMKDIRVRQFSGRGILVFPNKQKFEGEWIDGGLIGQAKITYPNGDLYLGSTYNFQRHGRGYIYFATGQKYVGEFSSGDFHGEGIFYNKEGVVLYDGEWRRGKRFDK